MNRILFILTLLLSVGVLVNLYFNYAGAADIPPVPADGLKMAMTKKVVIFNHSTHGSVECGTCHHKVNNENTFAKCGTAGCHELKIEGNIPSYKDVMHNKKSDISCLGCHSQIETTENRKKELTACKNSVCHN